MIGFKRTLLTGAALLAVSTMALPAFASLLDSGDLTLDASGFAERMSLLQSGEEETGMSAGNVTKGLSLWAQALARNAHQDRHDGNAGYDSETWGFVVGADSREVIQDASLGIAFTYARIDADADDIHTTGTDVDSYQLNIYGSRDLRHGWYVNGTAGIGWEDAERVRHNVGGLIAHGDFNAMTYSGKIETGRDLYFQGINVTPHIYLHGASYDPEDYSETGAGAGNLRINSESSGMADLGIGLRATWSIKQGNGSLLKPQLRVGYSYAFISNNANETAVPVGGGTLIPGNNNAEPPRSAFNIGGTIRYYTTKNWQFTASYDFTGKRNFTGNAGVLRAVYKF